MRQLLVFVTMICVASDFATEATAWWLESGPSNPDTYAAFRGSFELDEDRETVLRIFGAHVFITWLDGHYLTEGPWRFPLSHPEYETITVSLKKGHHVLVALVRNEGIETRILQSHLIPPFFMAQVLNGNRSHPISWKAYRLPGYIASGLRVSPQFAWVEWVDTRLNPHEWQESFFDDLRWKAPMPVDIVHDWNLQPIDAERLKRLKVEPKLMDEGKLSGPFEEPRKPGAQTDDELS